MSFFYLLSFYLYLRVNGAHGGRAAAWQIASLATFFLSLLSKEMALTLPLILVLYEHGYVKSGFVRGARRYTAYFVLAALYLGIRSHALGGLAPVEKLKDMTLYRFAFRTSSGWPVLVEASRAGQDERLPCFRAE